MPADTLEFILIDLEQKLQDTEFRRSKEFLENTLHDEFVEIGATGRQYNKQETIKNINQPTRLDYKASDFRTSPLSDEIVLLTYKLVTLDDSVEIQASLRSSIWKFGNNNWQIIFHQGTVAEQLHPD